MTSIKNTINIIIFFQDDNSGTESDDEQEAEEEKTSVNDGKKYFIPLIFLLAYNFGCSHKSTELQLHARKKCKNKKGVVL